MTFMGDCPAGYDGLASSSLVPFYSPGETMHIARRRRSTGLTVSCDNVSDDVKRPKQENRTKINRE